MLSRTHNGNIVFETEKNRKQSFWYADLAQSEELTSAYDDEQGSRFPGNLLPMVFIAIAMWSTIILAGFWLAKHLHF